MPMTTKSIALRAPKAEGMNSVTPSPSLSEYLAAVAVVTTTPYSSPAPGRTPDTSSVLFLKGASRSKSVAWTWTYERLAPPCISQ